MKQQTTLLFNSEDMKQQTTFSENVKQQTILSTIGDNNYNNWRQQL